MCLDRLEDFPTKDYGWKVFIRRRGKEAIWSGRLNLNQRSPASKAGLEEPFIDYVFPVNKWLDANNGKRNTILHTNDDYKNYKAGFHIFPSRNAAREFGYGVIRKVKFKEVITTGIQNEHKVIVAKKILVLPAKKRTKC